MDEGKQERDFVKAGEMQPWINPWSGSKLMLFRFGFCYLFFYCLDVLSFDVARLVYSGNRNDPVLMQVLWAHAIPWIGLHIVHLHKTFPVLHYGGDVIFEYLLRLTELVLALVGMAVWSVLDRRRRDYRVLDAYLRVFVRTMLASVMLFYGLVKVFPVQFGSLTLHRLMRPVGELRPMGMLWIFMAASPVYTVVTGMVEMAGGLLLLFCRTATLGALISAGAMANVLLLNVLYDVNQKIKCVHYLLLALFLLGPQAPRLWTVLVMNGRCDAVRGPVAPVRTWVRRSALWVPILFGLLILTVQGFRDAMRYRVDKRAEQMRGPYYGVWKVGTFTVADKRKPLFTAKLNQEMQLAAGQDHWTQLVFDQGNAVYLQVAGSRDDDMVKARPDARSSAIVLADDGDADWQCRLTFTQLDANLLEMTGMVNGNAVKATLMREGAQEYHMGDGIRWMSDGDRQF